VSKRGMKNFCLRARLNVVFALTAATALACGPPPNGSGSLDDPWWRGRLGIRPELLRNARSGRYVVGLAPVFGNKPEGAWVYAPASAASKPKAPLLLLLHGAGGSGVRFITPFKQFSESTGVILVAPKSIGATWDAIEGAIGPDVENIDRVLAAIVHSYNIDGNRISVAGFSDGATYALALGRLNGTLFKSIVAFSPGVLLPVTGPGKPPIFISHGARDRILAIDNTSRVFVPMLRQEGFTVAYHEFDGPHTVPPDIAALAMRWIAEH
jgi:phospholipase/carboxylesterase